MKNHIDFFHYSFCVTLIFFPNECPGLCRIDQGRCSLEGKIMQHKMKKIPKPVWAKPASGKNIEE